MMRLSVDSCSQLISRAGAGIALAVAVVFITSCDHDEPAAVASSALGDEVSLLEEEEEAEAEEAEARTDEGEALACSNLCEDDCEECGDLRCPSETRYYCVFGGCSASQCGTRTVRCECCAQNECLKITNGQKSCVACAAGQICTENNQCCEPMTADEACGAQECGSASDGCGRTLSCGTCPIGKTCTGGQCVTPPGACFPGSCRRCAGGFQICNNGGGWNPCQPGQCP